jgi:hypothetical protein
MCDCVIAAPLPETMEARCDHDCCDDLTKDLKTIKDVFKYNDVQGLVTCEYVFPWPLKNREICIKKAKFFDP